jgi:hypothetical protein
MKLDLKDIGWEDVKWINFAQNRKKCWALVETSGTSGFVRDREFLG